MINKPYHAWTNRPTYAIYAWLGDNLAEHAASGNNVTAAYCESYTRDLLSSNDTTVEAALASDLLEFAFFAIDWNQVSQEANKLAGAGQ